MKTHNRLLYHCVRCGNVVHAEPGEPNPHCCRQPMAKAAAETIWEREEEGARDAVEQALIARSARLPR